MEVTPLLNAERHKKLLDYIHEIYLAKNHDYGNSYSLLFKEYGGLAGLLPIANKFHRINNIVAHSADLSVADESLKDSLLDLANYCLMFIMELEESYEQN